MNLRAIVSTGVLFLGTTLGVAHAEPPKGKGLNKPGMPATAGPAGDKKAGDKKGADTAGMAKAEIKTADGKSVGTLNLEETPRGVLITADLSNLPAGTHAFHIHETGKCEAPFKTAGGHFNPDMKKHGMKAGDGQHAGDLPNIYVGSDGKARFEAVAHGVTLKAGEKNSLMDTDGSAFVLHDKADDYKTDPAGAAGDRIACGVVAK